MLTRPTIQPSVLARELAPLILLALVTACRSSGQVPTSSGPAPTGNGPAPTGPAPTASVNPALAHATTSLPPIGTHAQPVGGLRDGSGTKAELVEGYLLIRPRSRSDLDRFLQTFGGEVVRDDGLTSVPVEWGTELTAAQRAPREYVVRIDLARVDTSRINLLAGRLGWRGNLEFSSDAALSTFAAALEARAQGFEVDANFLYEFQQTMPASPNDLPLTLLSSAERTLPGAIGPLDLYQAQIFGAPGGTSTDVVRAWQFLGAHGIQKQVRVAIIDAGFFLQSNGQAQLTGDSDFVAPPAAPLQFDVIDGDNFADGMNTSPCTGGASCPWHGTGAAGVGAGLINNSAGYGGTGGLVGVPILIRVSGSRADHNAAVRRAADMGADVISMSYGTRCDSVSCRQRDRKEFPNDDVFNAPNHPVLVSGAGNNNENVGDPVFYHPCIEDHVICVGALDTGSDVTSMAKNSSSGFGDRVTVFAPTQIPVMSRPDGSGTPQPSLFGGTSAATPYVAGIAAMIKAVNPALNSDDVATILMQTSRPGVGEAKRVVDALAAVRRAAQSFPIKRDRHEPNGLEKDARDLGTQSSYTENNLNLDASDLDYFRINVPGASTAAVTLRYPSRLGTASVLSVSADGGTCAAPQLMGSAPLPAGNGSTTTYRLAGGPHIIGIRGDAILSYNLGITFAAAVLTPDSFESNDVFSTARYLHGFDYVAAGVLGGLGIPAFTPRVSIGANLHSNTDVDWYLVRGVDNQGKELGLDGMHILFNTPAVMIYGNESRIELEVFEQKPDRTPGASMGHVVSNSCTPESLFVNLKPNQYYFVKVTGAKGNYLLSNDLHTTSRRHPWKQHDVVWEALHPGEPIESAVDFTRHYAVAIDPSFAEIEVTPGTHLSLYDQNEKLIRESRVVEHGERLNIADLSGKTWVLEVARRSGTPNIPPTKLRWLPTLPARASENLVANPGAEVAADNTAAMSLPGWSTAAGAGAVRALNYSDFRDLAASLADRPRHGEKLFGGGGSESATGLQQSAIQQTVRIPDDWRAAINRGSVKASFAALLGGRSSAERAAARLEFLNARGERLGSLALASVGNFEREAVARLIPVSDATFLPSGTTVVVVRLEMSSSGRRGGGFADSLTLFLQDFPRQRQ